MVKIIEGINDLFSTNPELEKEWDFDKNSLDPKRVTAGSHKKALWICPKGHEWESDIRDRVSGKTCPYCSNTKLLSGYNDFATVKPDVAEEWNYNKNGDLKPDQVKFNANVKVWWKCSQGHEWEAFVFNRSKGHGCPYCTNRKVFKGYNDLETLYPDVAKEWDYEKNIGLVPSEVLSGSHRKVWWKCTKGHEWEAEIKSRTYGQNCPYCGNKKVLAGYNDLLSVNPSIAAEWSSKNTVFPHEIIRGSDKKYYWICPMGHNDYLMTIDQRLNGQGCPCCAKQSQTSFPEQALFFYIKRLYSDAINRYVFNKKEIDIFIPSIKTGIEYNGYFSHKGKAQKDAEKIAYLKSYGYRIIIIKEYKYDNECYGADFYIYERTTYESITNLIVSVLSYFDNSHTIAVNCENDQVSIKEQYIDSIRKNSIAIAIPEIVSEWNCEKNGSIRPEFVNRNSNLKYYWICSKCGHSYLASPSSRNRGTGCPACAGRVVQAGFNDLATKKPDLLKEWDYEKNGEIKPDSLFYRSKEVVWWKCKSGHSWQKSVYSRSKNRSGCPYCNGRAVIIGFNDLQTKRPDLAEEWDYTLNDNSPDMIHYNNQTLMIHWICKKCGYKWVHTVSQRNRCPECLRRQRQINVYNASDLSLYGKFENARCFCERLGIDYTKSQSSISSVCRRKNKIFMRRFILRYDIDDEFSSKC